MIAIVFLVVLKPSFAHAEDTGFVPARLERIAPWYQSQVDKGGLAGAVIAIVHDGKPAYLQAIGTQDRARQVPMKTNSIFWIASMTKPVTSVAAMMLVEEGKLDLNAPIATYLPELKDRTVGGQPASSLRSSTCCVTQPASPIRRKAIRRGTDVSTTSSSGKA